MSCWRERWPAIVLGDSVTQFSLVIGRVPVRPRGRVRGSRDLSIDRLLARCFMSRLSSGVALIGGFVGSAVVFCLQPTSRWFRVALLGFVHGHRHRAGRRTRAAALNADPQGSPVDFEDLVSRVLTFRLHRCSVWLLSCFRFSLFPRLGLVRTSLVCAEC